jgi:histidinol dehydrogenase
MLARLDLRGHQGPFDDVLPRPSDPGADVRQATSAILAEVRARGDAALRELTERFDGASPAVLRVAPADIEAALDGVPAALRTSLELAYRRIVDYHAHESPPPEVFASGGVTVRHLVRPMHRVGCYAPGGRARYPSTVLMCTAPARVAGVGEIALCVPPGRDGRIDQATLAAAAVAGVDEVYAVGGAQAIAAMAYGTQSIPRVDVIVGPGNSFVAEAKRQVAGVVGVASAFAGPSEVVVVAGPETTAALAAVDLVVQAEHGPDGLAWLVTWSEPKADEVVAEVARLVADSPRRADLEKTLASGGFACLVDGPRQAVAVANVIAPEHLELMVEDAEALLPLVQCAGAVFLGERTPASLGDYLAGPNHVLPTNRTARFASALSASDFRRHIHAVRVEQSGLEELGPHVITLAETEGLAAHAESIRRRL